MAKPVRLRELAATDLAGVIEHLHREAGSQAAIDVIDAVQRGFGRISRSPTLGSLRFAYELGIPGLRAWPIARTSYVVFYVDADEVVDVWRILHSRRDLAAAVRDPDH